MLKQRNPSILGLLLLLVLLVSPVCAATTADQQALLTRAMTRVDAGDIQIEQALASAIDQEVSFALILETCRQRNIPLAKVISAARLSGMTTSVTLARLAEAGVDSQQLAEALKQSRGPDAAVSYSAIAPTEKPRASASNPAAGQGLAYTPAPRSNPLVSVPVVTANPGGTAQGGSVSTSGL